MGSSLGDSEPGDRTNVQRMGEAAHQAEPSGSEQNVSDLGGPSLMEENLIQEAKGRLGRGGQSPGG